jgi:L-ascorbate metabolism protein UlaG (beta-lactamase superfamily)
MGDADARLRRPGEGIRLRVSVPREVARNSYYSGPVSDHFDGLRFFPPGGARDKSLADLWRMLRSPQRRTPWPTNVPAMPLDHPPERVEGCALRVSLVGHSSFLIQTEGVNLLLDPVWAERAGPFGILGPKRATPPGIAFLDLPPLDAILVSHNHYDHMDIATLSRLSRLRPCPILTPLGNDALLRRADAKLDARAFDWGESVAVGALRVHFEPALHWSARGRGDRRMALWASFVIEAVGGKVYCAGDTGYGDGSIFRALARKHGPIRLALIPIGAYAPRWFMRDQHCDPDEAVRIFQDLEAERAFACHWGAFRLTEEPYHEPVERLAAALARERIDPARFVAGPPGTVIEIP